MTNTPDLPLEHDLRTLSLEHDPGTPQVQDLETPPPGAVVSEDPSDIAKTNEGFIFGAATRLGGRILHEGRDPWTHNAWDNVEWDEEQEAEAQLAVERQQAVPILPEEQEKLNATPEKFWDKFYANVADSFFKDRAWPCLEFQALADAVRPDAGPVRVCEIGCGTGATAYPVMALNNNPDLFIHCLDYSKRAIQLVQKNPAYDESKLLAETWSLCDPNGLSPGVKPGSIEIVTLIFCLSALHPDEWEQAIKNLWTMLKPGGKVLFRDYGRNDLTQLRFKKSRYMQPGLYARGDKTRVYFFTKDELSDLFSPASEKREEMRFETLRIGVDRRLLMNRKRKLKMYRVWMQGEFMKPLEGEADGEKRGPAEEAGEPQADTLDARPS